MSSPRPEGFRFGRALPRSIDLEVEWRPIGDPDFHWHIPGIFIDRDGTIRVVDICRKAMRGMRVWVSRNRGRSWRMEKGTADADSDRGASLVGKERGKVLFSPSHSGMRPFRIWPLEAENLIKKEFRGVYEQLAHRISSGTRFFLARTPNDPKIMAFVTVRGLRAPAPPGEPQRCVRIFVTIDGGEKWIEINPTKQATWVCGGESIYPGGLAIKETRGRLKIFIGIKGTGPGMVQVATLSLSEIRETLAKR